MTDNDFLKNKYKNFSPEELARYNLLSPARVSGYICPFCGNGSGENGTGVDMSLLAKGYEGNCFRCHEHFDVFKIIAHENHLDVTTQFAQVFHKAKEIFGDAEIKPVQPEETPPKNFMSKINKWRGNLRTFISMQGGAYRGLVYEELAKYFCGYERFFESKLKDKDGNWYTVKAPRFIIPSSKYHFLARLVGKAADLSIPEPAKILLEEKAKQHFGKKTIFGKGLLPQISRHIFVVEGEFDAMSIDQCSYPAIAIGGSKLSKSMQEELKKFPPDSKFIVLLDNDETGREMGTANADIIESLGFPVVVQSLNEKYKDANEFLQADPVGLIDNLTQIYNSSVDFFKRAAKPVPKTEEVINNSSVLFMEDCPIDLNIPKDYIFNGNGIFKVMKSKDGGYYEKCLTNSPMIVTRTIATEKGEDAQIELAIYNRQNQSWRKIVLPRDILDSKNISVLLKFGVSVKSDGKKYLPDFFDDLINDPQNISLIPTTTLYTKPGWTDSTCTKFIIPPGDGKTYLVKNNGIDYEKAFATHGDKEVWLELFKETFSESFVARIAIGYALAGPLLEICRVRNIQLALVAPSGSGKSAILCFAVSIYGNPEELRRTHNGTMNASLETLIGLNSLVALFDEFQAAGKNLKQEIETAVYRNGEGKGRARLRKDGTMKKVEEFHVAALISAEENISKDSNNQGMNARLVEINAQGAIDDELAQKIHRSLKDHYGFFLNDWIDFIQDNREEIIDTYEKTLKRFTDRFYLAANMQALSIAYTANLFFLKMLGLEKDLLCDFLSDPEDPTSLSEGTFDFCGIMDIHRTRSILPSLDETKNTTRALKFIGELLHTHDEFFHHQKYGVIGEDNSDGAESSSYGDKGIYWTIPKRTPAIGVKYLRRGRESSGEVGEVAFWPKQLHKLLEDFGGFSSAKTIMFGLGELGYLEGTKANRFQVQKRYGKPSQGTRFYVFKEGVFTVEKNEF